MNNVEHHLSVYRDTPRKGLLNRSRRFKALHRAAKSLGLWGSVTNPDLKDEAINPRDRLMARRVRCEKWHAALSITLAVSAALSLASAMWLPVWFDDGRWAAIPFGLLGLCGLSGVGLGVAERVRDAAARALRDLELSQKTFKVIPDQIDETGLGEDAALYLGLVTALTENTSSILAASQLEHLQDEVRGAPWLAAQSLWHNQEIPKATGYLEVVDRLLEVRSEALAVLGKERSNRPDEVPELQSLRDAQGFSSPAPGRLKEASPATAERLSER